MFITSSLKGQREREFGWVFSCWLPGCESASIDWLRPFGCLLPCEQNLFPLEKRPPASPRERDSARLLTLSLSLSLSCSSVQNCWIRHTINGSFWLRSLCVWTKTRPIVSNNSLSWSLNFKGHLSVELRLIATGNSSWAVIIIVYQPDIFPMLGTFHHRVSFSRFLGVLTVLTLSLPRSKITFSQPFREKCRSELVRIGQ